MERVSPEWLEEMIVFMTQFSRETTSTGRYLGLEMLEGIAPPRPATGPRARGSQKKKEERGASAAPENRRVVTTRICSLESLVKRKSK